MNAAARRAQRGQGAGLGPSRRSNGSTRGGSGSGGGSGPGEGCMAGVARFFRGLFWLAVIVLAIYIVAVAL